MKDIIRDSTVGQLINRLSKGRYLPYADQRPDYTAPAHFLLPATTSKTHIASIDDKQIPAGERAISPDESLPHTTGSLTRINSPANDSVQDHEKGEVKSTTLAYDPYLVGWNGDDDPDNPRYVYTCLLELHS